MAHLKKYILDCLLLLQWTFLPPGFFIQIHSKSRLLNTRFESNKLSSVKSLRLFNNYDRTAYCQYLPSRSPTFKYTI